MPLDAMIARVIETLEMHESEVRHPDGTWYRLQVRPYRTADYKVGGAVIAFVDITALRVAREFPAAIVEAVPTPLVVIDERLRVRSANAAFYAAFAITEPEISGRELTDLGEWRSPCSARGSIRCSRPGRDLTTSSSNTRGKPVTGCCGSARGRCPRSTGASCS